MLEFAGMDQQEYSQNVLQFPWPQNLSVCFIQKKTAKWIIYFKPSSKFPSAGMSWHNRLEVQQQTIKNLNLGFRDLCAVYYTNSDVGPRFAFSGLVIYFCYGIHHSTEAALVDSSMDTEMNSFKRDHESEPMSPEKEAFLHNGIHAREEDERDL